MAETIRLEPNWDNLFTTYSNETKLQMQFLTRDKDTFTRSEVYNLVYALRLALNTATSVEKFVELREMFADLADEMFDVVQAEMNKPDPFNYDMDAERHEYDKDMRAWREQRSRVLNELITKRRAKAEKKKD